MSRILLLVPVIMSLPLTNALAAGDPVKGQRQFAPCTSCHTIGVGEPAKIGPNLRNVVGKKAATNHADFAYSDALKKSGLTWDDKTLDIWITNPQAKVPGSKMTFVGITKEDVRANIIAFLHKQVGADTGAPAAAPKKAPGAAGAAEE